MSGVDHIDAITWHGRKGEIDNAFRYSIDYILVDAEGDASGPLGFARNGHGLMTLWDKDHGGPPHAGRGAPWVREVMAANGATFPVHRIELLAQPKVLGHVFNPVSFWLIRDERHDLRAVIPEVSNTFGDRHSYLCMKEDQSPILPNDRVASAKIFHVSPFQPVEGGYDFWFAINDDRIAIRIDYTAGNGGLIATLAGRRSPLTTAGLLRSLVRRPFGSRRVLGLIHWQALKLWWKGARYRPRPEPPVEEVSR